MYEYMQIVEVLNDRFSCSLASRSGEVILMNVPDWNTSKYEFEDERKSTRDHWASFLKYNEERGNRFKVSPLSLYAYL